MSFVPSADQRLASERYHAYVMGWRDGAGVRPKKPQFSTRVSRPDLKEEYDRGYADGQQARRRADNLCAKRIGYVPNILRAQRAAEGASALTPETLPSDEDVDRVANGIADTDLVRVQSDDDLKTVARAAITAYTTEADGAE